MANPESLDCPVVNPEDLPWYDSFNFWTEGVIGCIISILGIFFNTLAIFVLCDKDMINSFNMMLTLLCGVDNLYLICAILESFRKSFHMATYWHTILFSKVLYPAHTTLMTASIFLTVGITFERYTAVHHPVDYNQAMNDFKASRRRVAKFAIPTLICCFLINIPKFFESELYYSKDEYGRDQVHLTASALRTNEYYATYYSSYGRIFFIGFFPFVLLAYFNYKTYKDIQVNKSKKKRKKTLMCVFPSKRALKKLSRDMMKVTKTLKEFYPVSVPQGEKVPKISPSPND